MKRSATAFAPATVANVAVGFDILGFAVNNLGDEVTVNWREQPGIALSTENTQAPLPTDPAKNTATAGLLELIDDLKLEHGFDVRVKKGIPVGSGLGGSAASAVGAIVAANALLSTPLSHDALMNYALTGEFVASGSRHADNVSPCLFGGLVLTHSIRPLRYVQIPVPSSIVCVLVHPHLVVETKTARAVLSQEIRLHDHVAQSRNLAAFLAACYTENIALLGASLSDLVIEKQRAPLIPGFGAVKAAALKAGALGCSISGAGPTVFAWADNQARAEDIARATTAAFKSAGQNASSWITPVSQAGARLLP